MILLKEWLTFTLANLSQAQFEALNIQLIYRPYITVGLMIGLFFCFAQKVQAQCAVSFDYNINVLLVDFQADSLPAGTTNLIWDFGTGDSLVGFNLTTNHVYAVNGAYQVCLTSVGSSCGVVTTCQTIQICPGCVWPGDANGDLIVDNRDLLNIGLAFNETGPQRANPADISFSPKPQGDFPVPQLAMFASGLNHKHADCYGDGFINEFDISVLHSNYNKDPLGVSDCACIDSMDIPLYFHIFNDSVSVGTTVNIDVMLGTTGQQLPVIYGVAFTLQYHPPVLDPQTFTIDYANSIMGSPNELINFEKVIDTAGLVDAGLSKKNKLNSNPYGGPLGRIIVIMEEDLQQKTSFTSYSDTTLHLELCDVYLIDNEENQIPVCPKRDSLIVYQITSDQTGIGSLPSGSVGAKFHPNPSSDFTILSVEQGDEIRVEVIDMLGTVILTREFNNKNETLIDVRNFADGLYLTNFYDKDGRKLETLKFLKN